RPPGTAPQDAGGTTAGRDCLQHGETRRENPWDAAGRQGASTPPPLLPARVSPPPRTDAGASRGRRSAGAHDVGTASPKLSGHRPGRHEPEPRRCPAPLAPVPAWLAWLAWW